VRIWAALLVAGGLAMSSAAPLAAATPLETPAVDRRGEEQTFLTVPEWFLVFSSAEYAAFTRTHTPDGFCFWAHIGQFWHAYADVIHETRARHEPMNWGYHLMIVVIGISTTVEYAAHSAYETVIGRLAAATASRRTPEDDFGARAAQEYVDFIRYRGWYEFDFMSRFERLWTETSLVGPNMIRKWERKYALSTEYLVKAGYGWLITQASDSIYDPNRETTIVLLASPCPTLPPRVQELSRKGDGSVLLSVPRFQGFLEPVRALARCGATFEEIAGNRSEMVASLIDDVSSPQPAGARLMTRQPIVTEPGRERRFLIVPIQNLAALLRASDAGHATPEHLFDY
jgi:hypothetical protein